MPPKYKSVRRNPPKAQAHTWLVTIIDLQTDNSQPKYLCISLGSSLYLFYRPLDVIIMLKVRKQKKEKNEHKNHSSSNKP